MSWVTSTIVLRTFGLQVEQLALQAAAHDRVDRAERLVHEQHRRIGGQRPGHADALLLARPTAPPGSGAAASRSRPTRSTSSSTRAAVRALSQPSSLGTVAMFCAIVRCGNRPDLLDDVADAAAQLGGRALADVLSVDRDRAGGRFDEPVDHAQRRRLAAARRADQHHERPCRDVEVERAAPPAWPSPGTSS